MDQSKLFRAVCFEKEQAPNRRFPRLRVCRLKSGRNGRDALASALTALLILKTKFASAHANATSATSRCETVSADEFPEINLHCCERSGSTPN